MIDAAAEENVTTWPKSLRRSYVFSIAPEFLDRIESAETAAQRATGRVVSKESPVSLREITETNLRAVLFLDVADNQHHLVAPNAVSVAQAHYSREAWMRAIYADETPVGFILVSDPSLTATTETEPLTAYIWRFMIDARYQGFGFGAQAFAQVIERCRQRPMLKGLRLSFVPSEVSAELFYQRFGFQRTGEVDEGEVVMALSWS